MGDIVFESLLNNTFAVSAPSRVSDGQGGWAVTYVDAGTVTGRIRPATSREREVARQEEREISHVLYVLSGEDIERGYLVEYVGTEGGRALTVEVQGVREPSLMGHHWEIDCLEYQKEVGGEAGS